MILIIKIQNLEGERVEEVEGEGVEVEEVEEGVEEEGVEEEVELLARLVKDKGFFINVSYRKN